MLSPWSSHSPAATSSTPPTRGPPAVDVLEVHVAGHRRKDEKANVARYARLGFQEYFYFASPRAR